MLCISIKIRKNSNVYRVINYGACLSTSFKKNSHSMIPKLSIPSTLNIDLIKFGYSEKATKFENIFHLKFDKY